MLAWEEGTVSTTTAGSPATWSADRAAELTRSLAGRPGPLLEVLHALQLREFGYLDPRAVPVIADELNLSRAEVHGVVSFYPDFRTTPPAPASVQVCRGEACQAVGAEASWRTPRTPRGAARRDVGRRPRHLDEVFCLGNCALGPSVAVDGRLHGRVDA